ncbi:unnamed protein product [Ranitomeya imitator]|uniref:Uncharacterized protein n=1 Tax=Ranitomeya imitator TaxID=111125 RepID=A0ABN9LPK1_9NEOB|nr:unnamed protein product [Ranitomeya imitator]
MLTPEVKKPRTFLFANHCFTWSYPAAAITLIGTGALRGVTPALRISFRQLFTSSQCLYSFKEVLGIGIPCKP